MKIVFSESRQKGKNRLVDVFDDDLVNDKKLGIIDWGIVEEEFVFNPTTRKPFTADCLTEIIVYVDKMNYDEV